MGVAEEVGKGACNGTVALDEAPVVIAETQETLKLHDATWLRPPLDGIYLRPLNMHTRRIKHMAQEFHLLQKQGTFFRAQEQFMVTKPRKDPLQCGFMRLH